jgi:hypothetical protein
VDITRAIRIAIDKKQPIKLVFQCGAERSEPVVLHPACIFLRNDNNQKVVRGVIQNRDMPLPECSEFIISQITDVAETDETFLSSDKCSEANFHLYKIVYPDYPYTAFEVPE